MIKFISAQGTSIYVNPNMITCFGQVGEYISIFFIGDNDYVQVKETEDEVLEKLYGQKLNSFTRTGNYGRL